MTTPTSIQPSELPATLRAFLDAHVPREMRGNPPARSLAALPAEAK